MSLNLPFVALFIVCTVAYALSPAVAAWALSVALFVWFLIGVGLVLRWLFFRKA